MQIVKVEWEDSSSDGGWCKGEVAKERRGISKCETVGYLLKKDRVEVTVCQNRSLDTGNIADTMSIPRKCVKKITVLKEAQVGN